MNKLTIPSAKLGTALVAGSTDKAAKQAEATSSKLLHVPVAQIKPIPGFNVRVDSDDYLAHRDMLVESIRANGFDETKPLAAYVAKEGEHDVFYVTDGYTRLDAVNTLNSDPDVLAENEIGTLPVLVRRSAPTLEDLTVALHTNNSGRPLTPFELGVVVKRLLTMEGVDKARVAARLAVTARYIDDVLLLADAPAKVRSHVLRGEFSSTAAIQELRRDPAAAVERISAAVAKATASGKKRATAKDVGVKMHKVRTTVSIAAGTDMKEIVKAVASQVRAAIAVQEVGEGENMAKIATVDGTINLVIEVPAPVAEPAPAKAAAKPVTAKKPAKTTAAAKPAAAAPDAAPDAAPAADTKTKAPRKRKAEPAAPAAAPEVTNDEEVILPPAVKSDPGTENANDDNI